MQMKSRNKKLFSLLLCVMLIVAMALCTTGCKKTKKDQNLTTNPSTQETLPENNIIGTGNTKFTFIVVDRDGNKTEFEVHTDKEYVGEALLENNMISGEDGDYGLYVKTVNGITVDYDADKAYWAFYINGEYGMTGVDVTKITAGATYAFKVEK